jgi:hypothetical protein
MLMNVEDIETDDLIPLLRLGTSEMFNLLAAVDLISRHRHWLDRPDFRRFIKLFHDDQIGTSAAIWWEGATGALDRGELSADIEQGNVLRMAASIATFYKVALRDVSERLSRETMKIAVEAIMYAGGYPESTAEVKV